MPPRRPLGHQILSSELGNAPFAMNLKSKTGRPKRKLRKSEGSPFVDSAVAVSDPEDDDDDEDAVVMDTITAKRSRKRKRSPSPPMPCDDFVEEDDLSTMESDSAIDVSSRRRELSTVSHDTIPFNKPTVPPLQLTFNAPKGHSGPFVVNLDIQNVLEDMAEAIILRTDRAAPSQTQTINTNPGVITRSEASLPSARAGFLDLPAELRNEIYRQVFVAETEIDFAIPTNFSRGAAFLRTCRQVYEEGRSILYSENCFYLNRRTQRYGSFWDTDWNEIGYRSVRKFFKSIGPTNTSMIRNVTVLFEDAVPSLNPRLACNEERRFVHDEALLSVLRHLADYGALQSLVLHFAGRKILLMHDQRFVEYLRQVKADNVVFAQYATPRTLAGGQSSKIASNVVLYCSRAMTRSTKLYD